MQRISLFLILFSSYLISFPLLSEGSISHDAVKKRPKIGLVLAGGGAKGASHIGVIRKLEELKIPIDFVAGTSMGSYIAGMYAMGLTADEIEQRTFALDWMKGYSDKVERRDLSLRDKRNRDEFQINADLGFNDGQLNLPSGYIQGQSMAKLLREATKNLPIIENFDDMPIPFRAVSLNLGKMQPYVFTKGNLVTAMQASMAIPGALKPIEYEGMLLADGALINNLPINVVRDMGADIIIAVDIGSDLRQQDDLTSYLNIIDQLVTSMTKANVQKQISTLTANDFLIVPKVSEIGVGEFPKMAEGIPLGEKAIEPFIERLSQLSLNEQDYRKYVNHKNMLRSSLGEQEQFIFDRIEVVTNSRQKLEVIEKTLGLDAGTNYSLKDIESAINRLYSQDIFERVNYEFIDVNNGEKVMRVTVTKKSWGPGFVNFMLRIEESVDGNSDISLGTSYVLTDINQYGAEWRNEFVFGTRLDLSSEFYTPIDSEQQFYWGARAKLQKQERNFYTDSNANEQILSFIQTDYTTFTVTSEFGWNINQWGVLAVGYDFVQGDVKAIAFNVDRINFKSSGPYVRLGYDSLDNIYFPTEGQFLEVRYQNSYEKAFGQKTKSDMASFEWLGATRFNKHSFAARLAFGGTNSELVLPTVAQDLGGYRNLSGYSRDQISSRYKVFSEVFYTYRLAKNDFGAFKFPTYFGISLERGNVWNTKEEIEAGNMISAASVSIGIDSNIGPIVLAYGRADTGEESVYFFLGSVF